MFAIFTHFQKNPMVVDIAAVDNFSIQFTDFIGESDRVVFNFPPKRATYKKFSFCRPVIQCKRNNVREPSENITLNIYFGESVGILRRKLHS